MTLQTQIINDRTILCGACVKQVKAGVELAALNELFAQLKSPSILGGNPAKKDTDRFSYWAAEPKEIFEFHAGQEKPFEKLRSLLDKYKLARPATQEKGMFLGGWIGYFSYELGRYIEKLPETTVDDIAMPLIRLCFYDKVICYDHIEDMFALIALKVDSEKVEEKFSWLESLLERASKITLSSPAAGDLENIDLGKINCNMNHDYYLKTIEKIKRYIYDGQVYQVNFSQRFDCDYNAEPVALLHWQNHHNPSGYAAYIDTGDLAIVSASPEMFITINDRFISTKPIKGTRRRTNQPDQDTKNFDELQISEKEQAELNMIIDLERNDMARICVPGTRKVTQQRTIEIYPTVFHAVATVSGELAGDVTICDCLKAMFPGGSITGAPKVSSMEIIDETEPTARGVYTGSIGFIGVDGTVSLNIAIRTIIIKNKKAYVQTGGGIVADSDPEAEWHETITKARALLAGINSVNRDMK
ncbi:anthranilate synthase component I family protein [Planctomycetota bacterium]